MGAAVVLRVCIAGVRLWSKVRVSAASLVLEASGGADWLSDGRAIQQGRRRSSCKAWRGIPAAHVDGVAERLGWLQVESVAESMLEVVKLFQE